MVGSRGFEPRSARSERAASADCATSRCGDHGRIRTATGQALDLLPLPGWATWPLVPSGGLEPPPHGLRTRRAAFTLRRGIGADPGDRTRTSAIPGPQAAVTSDQRWSEWRDSNPHLKAWKARRHHYPTFALVRPRVSIVDSQTKRGPVAFTGPGTPVSCQRTRSCELFGDSARIRTRTHEVWRLGCCRYTTLSFLSHVSTASETKPPHDLTRAFIRAPDQNKKGLLGDRPRRPVAR